ncbi:hypothetical protein RclHR1_04730011 [Rhizophagus clarus]|uniref:Uncharacterized protein n=1 Tax=Rhizophagus clarus TaxID=94130 RepID=A0A2Z6S0M5_9GLOM|nr:hypothetical protein RclHR1_04730011 [Rhizophagus clarus]
MKHPFGEMISSLSGIEKGSLVCQQRQAQSKVHRVTLLQETQFLSAHSVLHLWYWLKTIEEIPTLYLQNLQTDFLLDVNTEGDDVIWN